MELIVVWIQTATVISLVHPTHALRLPVYPGIRYATVRVINQTRGDVVPVHGRVKGTAATTLTAQITSLVLHTLARPANVGRGTGSAVVRAISQEPEGAAMASGARATAAAMTRIVSATSRVSRTPARRACAGRGTKSAEIHATSRGPVGAARVRGRAEVTAA